MKIDRRRFNGGHKSAGRKSKADELKLIENLNKYCNETVVFQNLMKLIEEGNLRAIVVYLNYKYGKPTEYKINDISVHNLETIGNVITWRKTEELNK